jgi:hypothetical protein
LTEPAALVRASLLVLAFAVLLYLNRDQWFHAEEWYALSYSRETESWWDWLFTSYNGHLVALPLLEYRLLRDHVGLQAYWPYATILVLTHLAVVVLLWRISVRAGAAPLVATVTSMPVAVLAVGSQNLLWAFLVTIVGAVAFGLGAIAVASAPERTLPRDGASVALALLALMCSGVGVVMLCGLTLLGWLQGGIRRALRLGLVPAALYVAWSAAYPFENPWGLTSWREVPRLLEYVARGATAAFDQTLFDVPYLGGLAVVVAVVYVIVRVGDVRGVAAPAYALACSGVVLLVAAGYTRIKLGVEQGSESRYSYVVVALAVPLCALALTRASRGRPVALAAIVATAIAVTAYNVNRLNAEADREAAGETVVRDVVLAVAYLTAARSDESIQDASAEPILGLLKVRDLRRMARKGLLPELTPPEPKQALGLAPHVLVGLERRPDSPGEGCTEADAGETVRIETGDARTEIPIRSDGAAEIRIALHDRRLAATSPFRELHWEGGPGTIVVLRPRVVAELTPTDNRVQFCEPARRAGSR